MNTNESKTPQSFDEYRKQMHSDYGSPTRKVAPAPKGGLVIAFGIFMILVYVGVGVLMLINFFHWTDSYDWMRISLGIILIIYGVFRGYRQFKGDDYYSQKSNN